jgi:hypothetical protein
MPLIDFFVLVSQTFCRASSAALTFDASISELLNFGFLFEGPCIVACPLLDVRLGTAGVRRCSTWIAVAGPWGVR